MLTNTADCKMLWEDRYRFYYARFGTRIKHEDEMTLLMFKGRLSQIFRISLKYKYIYSHILRVDRLYIECQIMQELIFPH